MKLNSIVNSFVWGPPMLILLVGTGVYLTIRTKFFSFTKFDFILKKTICQVFEKKKRGEGDITPFQALAATVDTGNIARGCNCYCIRGTWSRFLDVGFSCIWYDN